MVSGPTLLLKVADSHTLNSFNLKRGRTRRHPRSLPLAQPRNRLPNLPLLIGVWGEGV